MQEEAVPAEQELVLVPELVLGALGPCRTVESVTDNRQRGKAKAAKEAKAHAMRGMMEIHASRLHVRSPTFARNAEGSTSAVLASWAEHD